MKLTPRLALTTTLFIGGAFFFASCTSQQFLYASSEEIGDKKEIEELASFILVGSTTVSEVSKNLGEPSYLVPEMNGHTAHVYAWRSLPYVAMAEVGSDPDSYDPFGSVDGEGPEQREAYLFLMCDSNGVVQGMSIQGPPEG